MHFGGDMVHIREIIGERPVGTAGNARASAYIEKVMTELGYEVTSLPFSCLRWEHGISRLYVDGEALQIHPGPYSLPYEGTLAYICADTFGKLMQAEISGKLLILHGELAVDTLMPKDYPFYYPDEHRLINEYLEESAPAAVLACTKKHPVSGLSPFPVFEDGSFSIPNAYAPASVIDLLSESSSGEVGITISSKRLNTEGRQPVGRRQKHGSRKKVVLCAHMDTVYGTPGASDNASGVSILLDVMKELRDADLPFSLECVPFNGEEYYAASGQMAYLDSFPVSQEELLLVINIDGAACRDSRLALSTYHADPFLESLADQTCSALPSFSRGHPWVEGDHSIFTFQGIPALALSSADDSQVLKRIAHTPYDTEKQIDRKLLDAAVEGITGIIRNLGGR